MRRPPGRCSDPDLQRFDYSAEPALVFELGAHLRRSGRLPSARSPQLQLCITCNMYRPQPPTRQVLGIPGRKDPRKKARQGPVPVGLAELALMADVGRTQRLDEQGEGQRYGSTGDESCQREHRLLGGHSGRVGNDRDRVYGWSSRVRGCLERGRGPVWKMGTFRDRFLAAFGAAGPLTLADLTQPSGCHRFTATRWSP